ncbi:DUF3578 domain-containing protein [Qipengyuania sp. RANM35]|uniref:MrcB family domain-containing protein n=1 Tax=Qipengyuania sp. RANM35 TaxID=3068635 RepID=UPI0034DB488F
MSEEGFRTWLEQNYAPNTVNTKLFEIRQLQSAYGNLDELYDQDRLDGVMERLQYSAQDKAVGKPNPSKLDLKSDLLRDLSNYRTTINYYRNYREGKSRSAGDGATTITSRDIKLLKEARQKSYRGLRYADLDPEERAAHVSVHAALGNFAKAVIRVLGSDDYEIRLTSGFHLKSGVRGAIPKDLWFGIYRKSNAKPFAGSPQLFMIASSRGIEFGFAPSTHPSGFSNAAIKDEVRAAAPKIFDLLPNPESPLASQIGDQLTESGAWFYRTKTRETPNENDFESFHAWLGFLKSEQGKSEAGGAVSRYLLENEVDGSDLEVEITEMAEIFRPLMESIRPGANRVSATESATREFADRFENLILEFDTARSGPFQVSKPLWEAASDLREWLGACPPIKRRPHFTVGWSPGKGVWARVPWVSILNTNVTSTTQEGVYCVFLISQDLQSVYLTLAQGVTRVIDQNGPTEGARILQELAAKYRAQAGDLAAHGFTLGNDVDLKCDGRLAKNYERGTVAYMKFDVDALPDDRTITAALDALMRTYDEIAERETVGDMFETEVEDEDADLEPFTLVEAMDGLFMPQSEFERILSTWKLKKNLVLQGAPGVGKSFIARRLAYTLIGAKDTKRVEAVQFHQSYGYEDFVQGYRPDGAGGFARYNGSFHRFCSDALRQPDRTFVFIIDEINRGNLSKIFGELMLLMEADKRSPEWAVQLTYAHKGEPRFYIPDNVFLIGMMNTADRSLSLVDYALRRRFAFVTMEPQFSSSGFKAHLVRAGVPDALIGKIVGRMNQLNDVIGADHHNLGDGYRIGHSFFVPTSQVDDAKAWYRLTIETEIRPLLEEYWFDERERANKWVEQLLAD